ncbi:sodium:solute symporter [Sporanaerobium hydrogeniformans]|uniref:Sodium:solute symporter n=1 Tax=Sporanaerobium hydrogeniformans TaxID=3072179 RepID=A0AC61D9H7_9FIRM|nr:sodium/proline symporter [Sporanaerobium hydrogeniformans]PHV69366.1 sodium:solute symporter [Sporanaerobium hydrogeniformans]
MKVLFLVVFIVVMIGVGLYSKTKIKNSNDFFLGGRNMGGWITAFAYGTSYFSAVIFIGYAGGLGWKYGVSTTWIGIGNAIFGCFLAWKLLAKKTREMTHKLEARTMPEFFEKRYQSKNMKFMSAIIIFVFLVPYTASVYKGLGYIFESSFGISFNAAIFFMALLTAVYLILGGYVATAINDLIQGVIMLVGSMLMVYYVVTNPAVGGIVEGVRRLGELDPTLSMPFSSSEKALNLFGLVFLTSFGVWGLPQMIHKYYAIKDEAAIKKGTIISTVFALVIGVSAYFSGCLGRLFFIQNGEAVIPAGNPDMIIPVMLEKALPAALMGVIIVLILSASMSTLASLVLISSSTISIDFIKGFIAPQISEKKMMLTMRGFCVLFVALSYVMAVFQNNTIVYLMSLSWGIIAGMFLGPYLFGLWWKKTTKAGAWAGFVAGGGIIVGYLIFEKLGLMSIDMPVVSSAAMIASCIVVPLVSLVSTQMSKAHIEAVFGKTEEVNA